MFNVNINFHMDYKLYNKHTPTASYRCKNMYNISETVELD